MYGGIFTAGLDMQVRMHDSVLADLKNTRTDRLTWFNYQQPQEYYTVHKGPLWKL